ncbi:MAG: 50S ribosomal protein L35 [Nitrospinae bacterium]|nr:50S ribosomal protein L35 [Nitrospinota bacterium]
MPKIKTKRSAKKRFSVTAKGKVKMKKAFLRHCLTCKDAKRKRDLRQGGLVAEVDAKRVRRFLPYEF